MNPSRGNSWFTLRFSFRTDLGSRVHHVLDGSSTPEILLSLIELLSKNVFTGKLGASTIVGSAAFNLFVILAICIPAMVEYKRIAEFQVYCIT